jgi:hypothetical protein
MPRLSTGNHCISSLGGFSLIVGVLTRQTDDYCLLFLDVKDLQSALRGNYQNLPLANVRSVFEEKTRLYLSL